MVDTSDEWISSRTGISERRLARDIPVLDMAEQAAAAALTQAGLSVEDIDMVVLSTATPENIVPSLSCDLQKRLGLRRAFCLDISAACTGFIYGMDIATRYILTGAVRRALVVACEKLSNVTDYTDRSTCILFGDGAGAVVLEAGERPGGYISSFLASCGDGGENLRILLGKHIEMNGKEVYKFAVKAMPEATDRVLAAAGLTMDDMDFVIPHQANLRILNAVRDRHGIAPEKLITTIERYGNISSAGIPVCLDGLHRENKLQPGQRLLMVGFGGGLTYGAMIFEWSERT